MRGWIWAVLVAVVVLTAGLAGWFASRGSGGARVRQKVSRGGTIDGSEIKAPADALVDVDQSATEGTIRDSGITLS
jgi:hypothetical protein